MVRVIAAITVPDGTTNEELAELALEIEISGLGTDPTVWTFDQFFDDVAEGVVTRTQDLTQDPRVVPGGNV